MIDQYKESSFDAGRQEQREADDALSARQNYIDRSHRLIDYTPVEERGKPCLNGCASFDIFRVSCLVGRGRIFSCVQKCEKYREWMVSRFPDGSVGLARYLNQIRVAEAHSCQ